MRIGQRRIPITPFLVCFVGRKQDSVIFGPPYLKEAQGEFIEWLYRDVPRAFPRGQLGFRLGQYRGRSIAARLCLTDVEEPGSPRRGLFVAIGLCGGNIGAEGLCVLLGRQAEAILAQLAYGRYAAIDNEHRAFSELVRRINDDDVEGLAASLERIATEECGHLPTRGVLQGLRQFKRRIGHAEWLGVLWPGKVGIRDAYRLAAEVALGTRNADCTVFGIDAGDSEGGVTLFGLVTHRNGSPVVVVGGKSLKLGDSRGYVISG